MKRCPKCDSVFPDTDRFCELDGTPLVASDSEQEVEDVPPMRETEATRQPEESWKILAIVAVAGVAIGVIVFLVYHAMTRQRATESVNVSSSNSSVMRQQGPFLPSVPSPVASASPSVESSPSPSATPSASALTSPASVQLSSNQVSTGGAGKKSGPVTIKLNDGASIQADEAWQTAEGVWYRKGGVVALLDPKQIKVIEKVAPATPQPSASQSPRP